MTIKIVFYFFFLSKIVFDCHIIWLKNNEKDTLFGPNYIKKKKKLFFRFIECLMYLVHNMNIIWTKYIKHSMNLKSWFLFINMRDGVLTSLCLSHYLKMTIKFFWDTIRTKTLTNQII
jgi:hypothetical protein